MEVGRPEESLYEAVWRTATSGRNFDVLNSNEEVVWSTEADIKTREEDLTYPVIVHLRAGAFLGDDPVAILGERT